MIKQILVRVVKSVVPRAVLQKLFPSKFAAPKEIGFITIQDESAGRSFQMLLREDSMMEKFFVSHGLYGHWEKESLKIWSALAKKSRNIVDIGANTGVFTMLAENNNPEANVIAIEPISINFSVLSRNIEQNRFKAKAENIALSDKEGFATMFMLKDTLNYMTSVNDNRYELHPEIKGHSEVVSVQVPIKPFSFIKEKYRLESVDLIKIDVEGHEFAVLKSMESHLRQYKPVVLIEVIGEENAANLDAMFKSMGYRYISINEKDKSNVVDRLWDNDHHNFVLCDDNTIEYLRSLHLVSI